MREQTLWAKAELREQEQAERIGALKAELRRAAPLGASEQLAHLARRRALDGGLPHVEGRLQPLEVEEMRGGQPALVKIRDARQPSAEAHEEAR